MNDADATRNDRQGQGGTPSRQMYLLLAAIDEAQASVQAADDGLRQFDQSPAGQALIAARVLDEEHEEEWRRAEDDSLQLAVLNQEQEAQSAAAWQLVPAGTQDEEMRLAKQRTAEHWRLFLAVESLLQLAATAGDVRHWLADAGHIRSNADGWLQHVPTGYTWRI